MNTAGREENVKDTLDKISSEISAVGGKVETVQKMDRKHFARVISENGITFARGIRVEMELDEDQFVGGGSYLFGSVLEHFLRGYVSLNRFSQLVAKSKQRRGLIHEWQPRAGHKILM